MRIHFATKPQEYSWLKQALLGEIYGIGFFNYFIEHYSATAKQLAVFQQLLTIEQIMLAKLQLCVQLPRRCLVDNEHTVTQKSIAQAELWIDLPWQKLISTMSLWIKPYQQAYHQQALVAKNYQQVFCMLDEHETAIYQYLIAEEQHNPCASNYLDDFIQRYS